MNLFSRSADNRPRCPAGTGELAGFGTDHPGEGLCRLHTGSTTQRKRERMNDDFEDLTQRAGSIVGTEAQKLREQLGDEEYERYADYVNQCRAASVDSTRAHSQHTRMKAFGWWCGGVSALAVSSGAVVWLVR